MRRVRAPRPRFLGSVWRCGLAVLALAVSAGSAGAADEGVEIPLFPSFSLYALDNGTVVDTQSFRGRPVLLTFWASWCGPCRLELPELQKLHDELGDKGFVLLTVNVDDSQHAARRFLEVTRLSVPVYRMTRGDLVRMGVRSIPTNILIDPEGRPARIYEGYSPDVPESIRGLVTEMFKVNDEGAP